MNLKRITSNVTIDSNGCWIWNKSKTSAGYGQLTENKTYWTTHVYAFSCVNYVPKNGQVVRHLCHVKECCNPEHLVIGSYSDNYQVSVEIHSAAQAKKRKQWYVNGVKYSTCREAVNKTGISMNSIIKFTVDGVFNIEEYRKSCSRNNSIPKI